MNKSCCFVLQYNTEALVLVLQYSFGKLAILKQYQENLFDQSDWTSHGGISDGLAKEIEIWRVWNQSWSVKHIKETKLCRLNDSKKFVHIHHWIPVVKLFSIALVLYWYCIAILGPWYCIAWKKLVFLILVVWVIQLCCVV